MDLPHIHLALPRMTPEQRKAELDGLNHGQLVGIIGVLCTELRHSQAMLSGIHDEQARASEDKMGHIHLHQI